MNKTPIRLGPLALLLCMISICLTSLSMVSFANASANMRQAERYAKTVKTRYSLEQKGQEFLRDLDDQVSEEPIVKEFVEDGYQLSIEIEKTGESHEVKYWKIKKIWEEDEKIDDLWEG